MFGIGKRIILILLFASILLLASITLIPTTGIAGENGVGKGIPLQPLLDETPEGGTLTLPAGSYQGPIVIKKTISLVAQLGVTLVGEGSGSVLIIRAPNVTVQGLTIRNGGHNGSEGDALLRVEADGAVLKDNHTYDGFYGIHLFQCQSARVEGNEINGDAVEEIARRGNGIQLTSGGNHLLLNNRMHNVQDGIYFDSTAANRVEGNRVENSRYGFHLMFAKKIHLQKNYTLNSIIGSMIMDSEEVTVDSNVFTGQRDTRGYGLFIFETRNCAVNHNVLSDNTTGLALEGTKETKVTENWISGNAMGVKRVGEVEQTFFNGNALVANVRQIGGKADWTEDVWHIGGEGNYWDDYQGMDLNQDGIGDTPYSMANAMVRLMDLNPELSIFYAGPVQQLLEWIGKEEKAIDPVPLMTPDEKIKELGRISK